MQRYDFNIRYKQRSEIYLADALSRAYPDHSVPQSPLHSEFCHNMEGRFNRIPTNLPQAAKAGIRSHKQEKYLNEQIPSGWPSQKSEVPPEAHPYVKCQDELSAQEGILFKGSRIIIPTAPRQEILQKVHEGYLGVESSLRRVREALYWALMSSEIKDYVSNCSVCNTIQLSQV